MGRDRTARKRALRGVGLILVAGGYARLARPRMALWGADDGEVGDAMPGDGEVPGPQFAVTRAVTIAAPPGAVWPWIVQIGYHRAGWYAHDLFDNDDIPSAETILPEFQHLEIGQVIGEEGLRSGTSNPAGTWCWRSTTRRRSGWSSRASGRSSATVRCACSSGRCKTASARGCCIGFASPRLRWAAPCWPCSSRLISSKAARC